MTATVNTSLKAVNVSASLEASDHSGGQSFRQRKKLHSDEKIRKKRLFESSISMRTWGIYADLAALLDAISLIQTQKAFLDQARSALKRLEQQSNLAEIGCNNMDQTAAPAQLTSFITEVLHKCEQNSNLNKDKNCMMNEASITSDKPLLPKTLADYKDCGNLTDLIHKRLDFLDNRKEYLMGLAQNARLMIEEINKPCISKDQQNLNDATKRTLNELHSSSFQAFQSQTVRLPKTVLRLINN